jgi:arylsulfatase A-like enzyme
MTDQTGERSTHHPNILLITTDTQRCDTLACMGNPSAVSPHLDRLAREGVVFDNAYTACPVCMPARASLLTGTYPQTHGVIENGLARREHLTVYPDLLKQAGYTNIIIGKAHFGPVPASFDVQCIIQGEKESPGNDAYTADLEWHGYQRGASREFPLPVALHMDTFLVDRTIEAIEDARAAGAPFFAHCSLLSPHAPLDPPGDWGDCYRDRPLPTVNYRPGELKNHPAHMHGVLGLGSQTDRSRYFAEGDQLRLDAVDALRRSYYGLAAHCDDQIGRLIRYLDEHALRESTLVIFTSDHGTQLFDHGFDDKHNYYDASWRVPLVLSMPGTLPANERRGFASWTDLAPTILGAAGITCQTMQGFDLVTPLSRRESLPRVCAPAVLYKSCALVTDRWKVEYYFEEARGRLFDRVEDAEEQRDLYESPPHSHIRDRLLIALLAWHADSIDVQWLIEHSGGGGPIATIVNRHTRALRGIAADERLNERIFDLDV